MEQLPSFAVFVQQLPDAELEAICAYLARHDREYQTMMGELTKFRPITIRTKVPVARQRQWFRKFTDLKPEFAPIWLLAYGTAELMPIEEAALAKLPIELRPELGYVAGDPPPTAAQIVSFLRESEQAYGLVKTRQWANIFFLIMDPPSKEPVAAALNELGWNLSVLPESAETAPAA